MLVSNLENDQDTEMQISIHFDLPLMTKNIRCYDILQDMDIWQSREGIKINIF
jgi:hypothetical protein